MRLRLDDDDGGGSAADDDRSCSIIAALRFATAAVGGDDRLDRSLALSFGDVLLFPARCPVALDDRGSICIGDDTICALACVIFGVCVVIGVGVAGLMPSRYRRRFGGRFSTTLISSG